VQAEVPPAPEETPQPEPPQRVLRRPEEVPFFQKQNKE
jgi:hypothetical protein